jgi:hypothetical protein
LNRPGERRRGCGSFTGDPDGPRQGCFAETERVVVVTMVASTYARVPSEHVRRCSVRIGRQRENAVTRENAGDARGAGILVAGYRADPGATPTGHRGRGEGFWRGNPPGLVDEPGTGARR